MRSLRENLSYEDYLNHLERYDAEPDWGFVDFELIVPTAIFSSVEQVKGFIDWLDETMRNKLRAAEDKIPLSDQIASASGRVEEKTASLEKDVSINR